MLVVLLNHSSCETGSLQIPTTSRCSAVNTFGKAALARGPGERRGCHAFSQTNKYQAVPKRPGSRGQPARPRLAPALPAVGALRAVVARTGFGDAPWSARVSQTPRVNSPGSGCPGVTPRHTADAQGPCRVVAGRRHLNFGASAGLAGL